MKEFHRDLLTKISTAGITYEGLKNCVFNGFYKKPIGFNDWNFSLAVNLLIKKGYLILRPCNTMGYLRFTKKGKHYYDTMLKVNK